MGKKAKELARLSAVVGELRNDVKTAPKPKPEPKPAPQPQQPQYQVEVGPGHPQEHTHSFICADPHCMAPAGELENAQMNDIMRNRERNAIGRRMSESRHRKALEKHHPEEAKKLPGWYGTE